MPAKISDESIIEMILDGDADAFETLVQRYRSAVFGITYHLVGNFADAEDLTQEAFIQAFLSLHQLNNHSKFASWLKQIAVNACKMWIRDQQKNESISIEKACNDDLVHSRYESDPEVETENKELYDAVQESYKSLSNENRLVMTLRCIDGLTYEEIGKFLDLPISTVKWRLYDARRKLKKEIIEMVEKELKQHDEEFQKKMVRKLIDEQMQIFTQIYNQISSADKGHLYLQKRRINQPGGAQWVKVIWDDFIIPDEIIVNNQQYWRVATEEDDAVIKSEMGEWEDWQGRTYIYIRKKMDGGVPSDSVTVYGYNSTEAGIPLDKNENLKICHKPIDINQKLLDELKEKGFEKVDQKDVPSLRIGHKWADENYFQKVTQYHFKDKDGKDIYIEVAIPSSDNSFVEFTPQQYITGIMLMSIESPKTIVFYPRVEENSAISAVWANWGQFVSINMPLGFPIYAHTDRDNYEKQGRILDTTQVFGSFFKIFADYLGYPESVAEKPRTYKPTRWKDLKEWWERQAELHPEIYQDIYKKQKNEPNEPPWTLAFRGLSEAFYEAKNGKQPTAPPQTTSINDIKIGLSEIGLREIHRGKKDTTMVGALNMKLPEDSVQIEYRGIKGKMVIVDFMKFHTDIEAGEFCWQTKEQTNSKACIDDRTPFRAFRSSYPINKHVNAIWAEGVWVVHIRIPITKPSAKKSEQNLLPEEELREKVFKSLLRHFNAKD
jgi:RNA polymerase sigma-70 factor (ECF subfamily)